MMLPSSAIAFSLAITSAFTLAQATPRAGPRSDRRTAPRLSAQAKRDDAFEVYASASSPSTLGNNSQRYDVSDGAPSSAWGELPTDEIGVELDPGSSVGWRIHGKNKTAVLITMLDGTDKGPVTWNTTADNNSTQPTLTMDMYASIDTHYPARKNASRADTDATSGANVTYGRAKPVPFTTTLSISNVDCDTFHLTAILAYLNGSTTTLTGTDYINVGEVPSSMKNITIKVAEYPEMHNVFFIDQAYPSLWTAQFAPGPGLPTVDAVYSAEIQFCPD